MFKLAIVQIAPVLGDIKKNTHRINTFLEKTAGAQLVILPELASTGYDFSDTNMAFRLAEEPSKSKFVEMLGKHASANNQYIMSGMNEKSGDKIFNSSILIGPEGIVGIYRKMHLFMHEKDFFTPGEAGLCIYDIGFCKLGMQICFDYLFPEPWRILAQKGAEIICHPSNLLTQNATKALPGIALMNRVYIVTANRIGTEGELTFNGGSMITSPSGDVLEKAASDQEEIIFMDVDVTKTHDKMITSMNHVFDDRRPEQYRLDNC